MLERTMHFFGSEDGNAVEYALITALVALVIIGVVTTLGQRIQNAFRTVGNALPAS